MEILICMQGLFGGTDNLLGRLYGWLKDNNYVVDIYTGNDEKLYLISHYDLAIIPSSQLGDLYLLSKRGISIDRVLIWIMGMGAFADSYYNFPATNFFDKVLKILYENEVKKTLKWLINKNSIIFTDSVGIYNTLKALNVCCEKDIEDHIFPIAIKVPNEKSWTKVSDRVSKKIRLSWIGRVSSDFKEIPLLHLIRDLDSWVYEHNISVELTIVGDGDAIDRVKGISDGVSYPVSFIDNIPYDELNNYVSEYVDLLVAMGTSALDGAKTGCPTIIITPVRKTDTERVEYRWIYDSRGYSLGEYPDIDIATGQKRCCLSEILQEYISDMYIAEKCFEYVQTFDMDRIFARLSQRDLPGQIDEEMKQHIKRFYKMKKRKMFIKKIVNRLGDKVDGG